MRPILLSVLYLITLLAVGLPRKAAAQAGSVLCFGDNTYGEQGDGTNTSHVLPSSAFNLSGIKAIAAADWSAYALTSDGHVYAWGMNGFGQLGVGDLADRYMPTLIPRLDHVVAIAAGAEHAMALKDNGQVLAWGRNEFGALGLGGSGNPASPVLTTAPLAKAISSGGLHSMVLGLDGRVWTTGWNYYGQLGLGDNVDRDTYQVVGGLPPVKAIACGGYHSVVLTGTGRVYAAGWNGSGALGDGTGLDKNVFVFSNVGNARAIGCGCSAQNTFAVRVDGTVAAWGNNMFGGLGDGTTLSRLSPITVPGLSDVKAVSAGGFHTLFLLASGKAMATGFDSNGQLGDGLAYIGRNTVGPVNGSALYESVSAGSYFSMALKSWGCAKAWGFGGNGQLGNGTTVDKHTPTAMTGLISGVIQLATGFNHTLALKADGTVWATGQNGSGQLGIGNTTTQLKPVKVPTLSNVIAVSAGWFFSMALTSDGWVWAWGENDYGELGQGDSQIRTAPVRVGWGASEIAAGAFHGLALVGDAEIWSWGRNAYGQLGLGDTVDRAFPKLINGTPGTIAIAGGGDCSMALNADGTISSWGRGGFGQLANGGYGDLLTPFRNSSVIGTAIALGDFHSLYLDGTGQDFTCGTNSSGQLGIGNTDWKVDWTQQGQTVIDIAGGYQHSLTRMATGALYAFGDNTYGEIGDGTTVDRFSAALVPGMPYCTGIARGHGSHSAAITNPPVMLSSLKVSPTAVTGGATSAGTVTLTYAAGAGGLSVALSSNNSAATVPASVLVPAGSKTATFTVATTTVTAIKKPVITGTLVVNKTATLTVNP